MAAMAEVEAEAMDGTILPFTFYCRNARLCLKKAIGARKFQLPAQELSHLRKFLKLVSVVMPCHPLYLEPRHHKACEELQRHLDGVRSRVKELEQAAAGSSTDAAAAEAEAECHPPPLGPACPLRRSCRAKSPAAKAALLRPESSITPRIYGRARTKRRLDSPAASGSCASTGCKKKLASSSGDFLNNLHQRYPYAFSRRGRCTPMASTTRRSTPSARKASCAWEAPEDRACPFVGDSLKSAASLRRPLTGDSVGDLSPIRSRFVRGVPRVGALGLVACVDGVDGGRCDREQGGHWGQGSSDTASFKGTGEAEPEGEAEAEAEPEADSPPTRHFDERERGRGRTGREEGHLEKRLRSRSPGQGSTTDRHNDSNDKEGTCEVGAEAAAASGAAASKPPLPSGCFKPAAAVGDNNNHDSWEGNPPELKPSCSKKTRVDHSGFHLPKVPRCQPFRDKRKAKAEAGGEDDSEDARPSTRQGLGLELRLPAPKGSSVSSTDQCPRPLAQAGIGVGAEAGQREDKKAHQVQQATAAANQNAWVREECERFRAELRALQGRAQDSKYLPAQAIPRGPRSTHSAAPAATATQPGGDHSVVEDDDASSTQPVAAAHAPPPVGILHEPVLSPNQLAAEREKVVNFLQCSRVLDGVKAKEAPPHSDKLRGRTARGNIYKKKACAKSRNDCCSSASSPSSSSHSSSGSAAGDGDDDDDDDKEASMSSLSLSHYARKLNQKKKEQKKRDNGGPGRTHPCARPADHHRPPMAAAELSSTSCPCSPPITLPTSFPHPTLDSRLAGGGVALSESSTTSCFGIHETTTTTTPEMEPKLEEVLGRCALSPTAAKRAGSPVKQGKQPDCCGLDDNVDTRCKPTKSKLPPPSYFFIDLSDKVTSSSRSGDAEDHSWCQLQKELEKNCVKNMDAIPSAVEAHKDNPDYLGNRLVSFVAHKLQSVQNEVYEKKISSLNRLVGELKGSVEGFRIRIDVEGEGWRGRVVGLEKELECLKDETEEELVDMKRRLAGELRLKIDQIVAEKVETDECCRERLMDEMRCFKSEIGSFVRDASKKVFMSEVQTFLTDHHAEVAETKSDLKKELEYLMDEKLEGKITDAIDNPNGYFRKHLQHIRRVAAEVKLESQGLKKLEDALKAESKHIRKVVSRLEKDDIKRKLEMDEFRRIVDEIELRPRTGCKREGSREKLLIMERVEALSQMYLGGLEEVRSDLYGVKRCCRERIHALENQWTDFQKQQLLEKGGDGSSMPCSGQMPRKFMLDELERFREELDEMKQQMKEHGKGRSGSMMCDLDSNSYLQRLVETERGYVRGLLERESSLIRGQVIDICEANKHEVAGILKAEVQKRVCGLKDKTDCMTSALKSDVDCIKNGVLEVQEVAEEVGNALKRAEKDRDRATAAAAEACQAASRASEVLEQVMGSFSNEMANARRKTVELQEGLITEARRASVDVQQQRDLAVAAVAEARTSSEKVGNVLQEVVGSFSTEMGQAKRKSLILQENLEKEIMKVKGTAKEIESTAALAGKAVSDFHFEMDTARRKSLQLQEEVEKFQSEMEGVRRKSLQLHQQLEQDMASLARSREAETRNALAVTSASAEEDPTCSMAQKLEQDQEAIKDELRQLAFRIDEVSGAQQSQKAITAAQPDRVAGNPTQDVTTREESLRLCVLENKTVDASTGQLGGGEGVSLRLEHIEKRGAGADANSRHEVLSIQHKGGGISVSVPFRMDGDRTDTSHTELLQGDVGDGHSLDHADNSGGMSVSNRISNLETRLENVASATFSNLRLLDGKVEHVSVAVQAALEGAACAENKCAALGVELVKVFRMLARRPGSAASPGADSYDHARGHLYSDHGSGQGHEQSIPVRQGNARKGCPVHDRELGEANWASTHPGEQSGKDITGPSNAKGDSQRTKIKLDGGRIQVNVTSHHRQNKRPAPGSDMIVVQ